MARDAAAIRLLTAALGVAGVGILVGGAVRGGRVHERREGKGGRRMLTTWHAANIVAEPRRASSARRCTFGRHRCVATTG